MVRQALLHGNSSYAVISFHVLILYIVKRTKPRLHVGNKKLVLQIRVWKDQLTHLFPINLFLYPLKTSQTLRFSDVFRG